MKKAYQLRVLVDIPEGLSDGLTPEEVENYIAEALADLHRGLEQIGVKTTGLKDITRLQVLDGGAA